MFHMQDQSEKSGGANFKHLIKIESETEDEGFQEMRPSPAIRVVDSGPLCDMTVADSRDEASRFTKREADTNVSEEIDPVGWSIDPVSHRLSQIGQCSTSGEFDSRTN